MTGQTTGYELSEKLRAFAATNIVAVITHPEAMEQVMKFKIASALGVDSCTDQVLNALADYIRVELQTGSLDTVDNYDVIVAAGTMLTAKPDTVAQTRTQLKNLMSVSSKAPRNPTLARSQLQAGNAAVGTTDVTVAAIAQEDRQSDCATHRQIVPGCNNVSWDVRKRYPEAKFTKPNKPGAPAIKPTDVESTAVLSFLTTTYKNAEEIRITLTGPNPVAEYAAWMASTVKDFKRVRLEMRPLMVYADVLSGYLATLEGLAARIAKAAASNRPTALGTADHELIFRTAEMMIFINPDTKTLEHALNMLHRMAVARRIPSQFTPALEVQYYRGEADMPSEDVAIPAARSGPLK